MDSFYMYAPPAATSGPNWCSLLLIFLVIIIFGTWVCSKKTYGDINGSAFAPKQPLVGMAEKVVPEGDPRAPRDLRCGIPQGPAQDREPIAVQRALAQQPVGPVAGVRATAAQSTPDPMGTLSFVPNVAFPLGAPFMNDSFAPSEATAEYYQTFNPNSLAQMMPAQWRAGGEKQCKDAMDPDNGQFDDFSRYSITPQAVQKSENIRGILRLRENTQTTNAKALGLPSLLREAVTPLSAVPIGDKNFFSHDSQQRLSYIASALGAYPTETSC
jgi:hypothetical protein